MMGGQNDGVDLPINSIRSRSAIRVSAFGFLSDFGFRISDFGSSLSSSTQSSTVPFTKIVIRILPLLLAVTWLWGGIPEPVPIDSGGMIRFQFSTPHLMDCRIEQAPELRAAAGGELDWITAWIGGDSSDAIELGSRVVLQLENPLALGEMIEGRPLELSRTVTPNVFILQAPGAWTAAQEAHRLAGLPGVAASYPVLRRSADLHGRYAAQPSDFFFYLQWPLENRDTNGASAGPDLNIRAAWPFTMGEGVTIAVVDTGVELVHQELASRAMAGLHFNFATLTDDGSPFSGSSTAAHGTQVAGLAVAELDNERMAGVAPRAGLASWVIYDSNARLVSDERLMEAYQHKAGEVAIQNHSWGSQGIRLKGPTLLEQIGLSNALHHGRSGLGVIMVRSAGNDRKLAANVNDDGYPSDPRVIAVAAMRQDGLTARYSEPGACILVSGPSNDTGMLGLFSTDLLGPRGRNQINFLPPFEDLSDYVFDGMGFTGTSAATPLVAGVTALMLSINPELTYRDVQQILVLSSRHFDFTDPDLRENGAGFLVSHNAGFGMPDAGVAVQLARGWSNRPPLTKLTLTSTNSQAIPDDGLRLLISGEGVPPGLASIRTLPSTGPHADTPTAALSLVDAGLATNTIPFDLTGRAALIERGVNDFTQKITFAAEAGAAFAVVYNFATNTTGTTAPGGDQLMPMGETDFVPIPAVFIGHSDGVALRELFETNTAARAQIHLTTTNYSFIVTNTLVCEHAGVRVQTDHPLRGDLRITLVSPAGTRSVLQQYNADTNAGLVDWTYYSTQHFFESSAGEWTVFFSDQLEENTGAVHRVSLIIHGTPILDTDGDGLDDEWELSHFGHLDQGPRDDPDEDGWSNAAEQIQGTNPKIEDVAFQLDLSKWNPRLARLSWPGKPNHSYDVLMGTNAASLQVLTNVPGKFPETEWFTPYTNLTHQFFRVHSVPDR
jgi:subtilisin family serine protease/subtilisin-like proprotein convertase family protein